MAHRAFPVIYTKDVQRTVAFYVVLRFEQTFAFPPGDEPGYVGLTRGESSLGVVSHEFPRDMIGAELGAGSRFEMFVYVDDVDAEVSTLRAIGVTVLREPEDMPWGERVAYVADQEGNPVALANASG